MSKQRKVSEGSVYHVISRGTGRQMIFEDDDDCRFFLYLLRKVLSDNAVELYAWCLMSNHFHLLLHGELESISLCMHGLCSGYAHWFNEKAGRTGHLFQERFRSDAIDTDAYLLTVIRYIHQNPVKAGLSDVSTYRWSSYQEYVGRPELCATRFPLEVFGGRRTFVDFHMQDGEVVGCIDVDISKDTKRAAEDARALRMAQAMLDNTPLTDLKTLPKEERNAHLGRLKRAGFSIRQLERLTGIGRNIIARA